MDVRNIFAYPLFMFQGPSTRKTFVVACKKWPPGRPDRRGRIPVSIDHCGVRAVRREAPLPARPRSSLGRIDQMVTRQKRAGGN